MKNTTPPEMSTTLFNFDAPVHRRGSHAYKWDSAKDDRVLPMWVADMDFQTAPCVINALHQRVEHGVFGYTQVPKTYFDAVTSWFEHRHQFHFSAESVLFTTGVVPALSAIIQALCQPGDGILVQTPAYNCFFSSIRNSQCHLVANPLRYQQGEYSIDFEDLAQKAAHPRTTLMLLCNPHNPVGRAWSREELSRIGQICLANNVTIVSDEIHCDLTQPGYQNISLGAINQELRHHSVTCVSPSKSFNLAGLQVANIIVEDSEKRQKIDRQLNINEVCEISPFAVEAVISAYQNGGHWLDALRHYLAENNACLRHFLNQHLPHIQAPALEATYLVWLDCSSLQMTSEEISHRLYEQHHLWLNAGTLYGPEGEGFLRMNIATPRHNLLDGLQRLKSGLSEIA